jgi:hypothetical protein
MISSWQVVLRSHTTSLVQKQKELLIALIQNLKKISAKILVKKIR